MAHNLNFNEKANEYSLYLLKEKAWHGLGQIVETAKTAKEVIQLAHLDYHVDKVENFAKFNNEFLLTSSFSTIRTDTKAVLGSNLGNQYLPLQNEEAFNFFESLVMSDRDITYETAGALGNGETVFVTAKLPSYLRIKGSDDIIEKYLLFTNSHNGSSAMMLQFTDVRVVCNNTLSMALKDKSNRVTLKHTKTIGSRIEQGRQLMNLCLSYNEELLQVLEAVKSVNVTEKIEQEFVHTLFLNKSELQALALGELSTRKSNILAEVKEAIQVAPGQDQHRGTGLWLYNGITSYFQNVKEYRSDERKFSGILMNGEEEKVATKALNHLLQLV